MRGRRGSFGARSGVPRRCVCPVCRRPPRRCPRRRPLGCPGFRPPAPAFPARSACRGVEQWLRTWACLRRWSSPGRAAPGPPAAACAPRPSRRRRCSPARGPPGSGAPAVRTPGPRVSRAPATLPRPVPRAPFLVSLGFSFPRSQHVAGGPPAAASTSKSFVALRHGSVFFCRF